jgi:hypothetical protein
MDADEQTLRQWLAAEATRRLLRRIAARIEARLAGHGLRLPGLGGGSDAGGGPEARAERVDEIQAELALYLLEKAAHFGSRLRAGVEGLERQILFGFVNHMKDRVRNYTDDPFRYLYRRAREVLSDAPGFFTALRSGRYLMFSLEPQNASEAPLSEEELASIGFPTGAPARMDYAAACRAESLRHLAAGFWREACARRGAAAQWVDLRDFCSWLARHLVLPEEVPEAVDDLAPDAAGGDRPPEHLRRPDEALRADELRLLALAFDGRLTARERTVLRLRDGLGLPWEEVARRMGYRGPAGPTHPHACARLKLQSFLRDQERLSPEDFDEDDFRVFWGFLIEELKNGAAAP